MAADAITSRLLEERRSLVTRAEGVKQNAFDNDRDLSEQDRQSLVSFSNRVKEIDGQLDISSQDFALNEQVAQRISTMTPGLDLGPVTYRSAGELMFDVIHYNELESRRRYDNVVKRAAQHMGTTAANTVATAGGFGGLQVSTVTGPVINITPQGRPLLSAIGVQDAPNALTFMRPRLVDPNFSTGVAAQSLEKAELASKAFDVVADPLTLKTRGGYLNLSLQAQSLVPAALDLVIGQLNRRLAYSTEVALVTELALTTASVPLAATPDGAAIRTAIFAASELVYTATKALPTWIAMGPIGWRVLGASVDLAGRPLFPTVGPANANGSISPGSFEIYGLGLTGVVTPAITTNDYYVGNSAGIEAYEYRYPTLEAVEPSVLGRQVAVASSLVLYRPPTTEAGPSNTPPAKYEGVVKIDAA
jgi:hypothetical protein